MDLFSVKLGMYGYSSAHLIFGLCAFGTFFDVISSHGQFGFLIVFLLEYFIAFVLYTVSKGRSFLSH
jgi:hypothetical protein